MTNWIEVLVLLFVFESLALFAATAALVKVGARATIERDAWLQGFNHLVDNPGEVKEALEAVQAKLDDSLPFLKASRALLELRDGR